MTPTKKPDTEPETVEAEIVDTKEIAVHEVEKQVGTVGES